MPRTYVDNAYNRSVGRVGMTLGTAVVSRSTGGGSSYSGGGSSRSYVDNSMNRSLGRVGMPLGTAVYSSSSSNSYSNARTGGGSSDRTYVDNAMNRSLGRVGLAVGTAVHSTSNSSSSTRAAGGNDNRTYVDNSMNRSLGRVGQPVGSAVQSSSALGNSRSSQSSTRKASTAKTYVDNAYNRRLGRVGLPFGTAVVSSLSSSASKPTRRYVDNPMNRNLGRVGKIVGTAPVSKANTASRNIFETDCDEIFRPLVRLDPEDDNLAEILERLERIRAGLQNSEGDLDPAKEQRCEAAIGIVNRHEAALSKYNSANNQSINTPNWVRGGEIINFQDLALGEKLGSGGFGDVHVAFWKNNCQVAVKKLRVQRVSQQRKDQFQKEVKLFSSLSHPAIVRFYGVCINPPNLAIIMEFMLAGSLYDILHVEQRDLNSTQKQSMISDCLSAIRYLHDDVNMAHRDLKSMNILVTDDYSHAKLSDFGLALKEESRSSSSVADHGVVGTLKYSPPEVLEGQRLTINGLKRADIYSICVVIGEIASGRQPYPNMNQHQVRAAVLRGEQIPFQLEPQETLELIKKGMHKESRSRPTASELFRGWSSSVMLGGIEIIDIGRTMSTLSLNSSSAQASSSLLSSGSFMTSSGSSRSSSRRSCPICRESKIEYVFTCGHGTCTNCLDSLRSVGGGNSKCPTCRTALISTAIRVYI